MKIEVLTILLLVFVLKFRSVTSTGHVMVTLIEYNNEEGNGDNGHCCEGKWGFCSGSCDHYFKICFDENLRKDRLPDVILPENECSITGYTTDTTDNENTIVFSDTIGETINPKYLKYTKWTESNYVSLSIDIYDEDNGNDDFVEHLYKKIYLQRDTEKEILLEGRTSMKLKLKRICSHDWYGNTCNVYCKANNKKDKFTCDQDTGAKICHDGWEGSDCNMKIKQCPLGYKGDLCEQTIVECADSPCKSNASCLDLTSNGIKSYECQCLNGYMGRFCDVVNYCYNSSNTCQNNGICLSHSVNFTCDCKIGWEGDYCEKEIDYCLENDCPDEETCVKSLKSAPKYYSCIESITIKNIHVIDNNEFEKLNYNTITEENKEATTWNGTTFNNEPVIINIDGVLMHEGKEFLHSTLSITIQNIQVIDNNEFEELNYNTITEENKVATSWNGTTFNNETLIINIDGVLMHEGKEFLHSTLFNAVIAGCAAILGLVIILIIVIRYRRKKSTRSADDMAVQFMPNEEPSSEFSQECYISIIPGSQTGIRKTQLLP